MQAQERLAALVLLHVEHEEQVARRQLARLRVARRPRRHDEAPARGVALDLLDDPANLVVERGARALALAGLVHREVAPEVAVRARHAARRVGPRVPELAAVLLEQADVRLAAQEPQVLDDDVLPGDLLGREERKALAEVDLVVLVERRDRIDPRSVGLSRPLGEHVADEVEVLLHKESGIPPRARGVNGREVEREHVPSTSTTVGFDRTALRLDVLGLGRRSNRSETANHPDRRRDHSRTAPWTSLVTEGEGARGEPISLSSPLWGILVGRRRLVSATNEVGSSVSRDGTGETVGHHSGDERPYMECQAFITRVPVHDLYRYGSPYRRRRRVVSRVMGRGMRRDDRSSLA